jgi:glyoxylase-like metal-dependent hydrolase (beta-lactamase superfamily II)
LHEVEIIPIRVAELELPETHPEGPGSCEVFAFLVRDGDTRFLVDTGVGEGNTVIETLYKPRRSDLVAALGRLGVEPRALSALVNSHLHFDHCGNNRQFPGVPIFVQEEEYDAASAAHYTVPGWVHFAGAAYRRVRGRRRLSPRVELIPSPGHTPGHQSVLVETARGTELVVAQAAYSAAEFASFGSRASAGRPDAWSPEVYVESLAHLHALQPVRAFFSHDSASWSAESRA